MSALDQIRKLDEERAKILAQAKKEALTAAEKAVEALNELGFEYQLVEKGKSGGGRKGTRSVDENKPCPICKFRTTPENHDARKHRAQGENKRPFTDQELAQMGLKKAV